MKRILKIWTDVELDDNPDTSWLGEYSSKPGENAIDREANGDMQRGELRYFNPAQHHDVDGWDHVSDLAVLNAYAKQIQAGYQELSRNAMIEALNASYRESDYQRMESLQRGDWNFVGITARAQVILSGSLIQNIRSGGLWGIESDSDEEHFEEVRQGQLAELGRELEAVGFDKSAIQKAMNQAPKELQPA